MVSVRKDHASPPAPVAESWRRIEAWLDEHLPILKLSLRPGISRTRSGEVREGGRATSAGRRAGVVDDPRRATPDPLPARRPGVQRRGLRRPAEQGRRVRQRSPAAARREGLPRQQTRPSVTGSSGPRWSRRQNVARTTGCSTSSARRARPPRRGRSSGSTPAGPGYPWSR